MPDEILEAPNTPSPESVAPASVAAAPASPAPVTPAPSEPVQPAQPSGWWTQAGLPADETAAQAEIRQMRERLDQYSQRDPMYNALEAYKGEFAEFLDNRDNYLKFRQSNQQPAAPPAWYAELGEHYQPGQWDPSWANHVQEDGSGNLVLRPGGRMDVLAKAQQYVDRTRKVQQKFWENPAEYIAAIVDKRAQTQAQQVVQQQLGQRDEAQNMAQFEQMHAHWLFENDGKQFRYTQRWNPRTRQNENVRQMSKRGQRFCELVQNRHDYQRQRGMLDPEDQLQWAMTALENEYYRTQGSQAAPTQAAPPADARTDREKANDAWLSGHGKEAPVPAGVAAADMSPLAPNEIAPTLLREFATHGVKPEHFVR